MKKQLLITIILTFTCGMIYCQNLIRVNNNPGVDADFTTLQDANDNASGGDTIYVEGSVTDYAGADINKSVTIIGPGYFLTENPNTQANGLDAGFNSSVTFSSGSEGSVITGCNLNNNNIFINVNNITVKRCYAGYIQFTGTVENVLVVQNYVYYTIQTYSAGIITNSVISNNIVEWFQIYLGSYSGSVQVANNILINQGAYTHPVDCYNSTIQNNIITDNVGDIAVNSGNTINNNILAIDGTDANGNQYSVDMDMVFADFDGSLEYSTDAKWQLKAGSPAIGAGTGGEDCGAFGGVTPYILSGIPELPHIYDATIPSTASSQEGLSVTIKVKSGE